MLDFLLRFGWTCALADWLPQHTTLRGTVSLHEFDRTV
jgi:hypothetical protein